MCVPNKIPECWSGGGVAIEIHCGAGEIMTRSGSRAQIGIGGFFEKANRGETKNDEYQQGIAVSWVSSRSPRAPKSSYAGGNTSILYGFDMAMLSKGLLEDLMFRNMGVEIPTYVRNDNSDAAYQVDSVNTVANVKRLDVFLERVIERG